MLTPTLIIKELTFSRDDRYFFENLNFTLYPGEILQIQGANGSGKSTLLRILAGFIQPHEGSVYWENRCIFKEDDSYKRVMRYLSDRNALKSYLTVKENLELSSTLTADPFSQRRESICIDSRLSEHGFDAGIQLLLQKQVQYLSLGQLRRVSLTRILLNPGKIWLLDEPMSALDKKGQDWLSASIEKHLNKEGMVVIATHQPLILKNSIKNLQLGDRH